jgi:signal transduction histidine kinase
MNVKQNLAGVPGIKHLPAIPVNSKLLTEKLAPAVASATAKLNQSFDFLNAIPEESFDTLNRLALQLVNAPFSFIALRQANRNFYAHYKNSEAPLTDEHEQTGRILCEYTLAADTMVVVEDMQTYTPRYDGFKPNLGNINFCAYIGIPLRVNQQAIASLCVADVNPHDWDASELEGLVQLASVIEKELSLYATLSQAQAEAEHVRALARAKEDIIAALTHHLRTPLQALQMCLFQLKKSQNEDTSTLGRRMNEAMQKIQLMVGDLLSDKSLSTAQALPRSTSAKLLMEDAIRMMEPHAHSDGIELQTDELEDGEIIVDYAQMLRALGNLIDNAIKYSPLQSIVRLSVRRKGAEIWLQVADDGPGISDDEQTHLFVRSIPGPRETGKDKNAKVGLAMVKAIVERHGGRVSLTSQLGLGSEFTIALPTVGQA